MKLKELLEFIDLEDGRLRSAHENYPDHEKRIMARMIKLSEEVGELSDEVLAFNAMQRKDKQKDYDGKNLPKEIADVLIVTLLLAKAMGVNIEEALRNKIEKINERY